MEEKYQIFIVTVIGILIFQFLFTRYYVANTVEQTIEQAVNNVIDEKVKKNNKKLMKTMKATFEKYIQTKISIMPIKIVCMTVVVLFQKHSFIASLKFYGVFCQVQLSSAD